MRKILLIVMMLLTIVLTSACTKKEATPRTMDNFLSDFTLDSRKYDGYERMTKNVKGDNKYAYLDGCVQRLGIYPKYKTIIKSISFTIYNHSESDFSFNVCDPSYYVFIKSKSEGKTMYQIGVSEMVPGVELKPNEEYTITYTVNEKVSKGSGVLIYYSPYVHSDTDRDYFKKILANGGIYNFKIDYEIYL